MRNLRFATIGVVAGGLLSLGGIKTAVAQAEPTPQLDIGTVAAELELSDETARELAPLLDQLNDVFRRREEHWRQGDEILAELDTQYEQIAETLSATELREFNWLLRQTAYGSAVGRTLGGYMMGGGRRGAWNNRGPAMRGGRGGYVGRGVPMRGMQRYPRQMAAPRGMRGAVGWNRQPYWRFDDEYYPNK